MGTERTLAAVAAKFYWVGMSKSVRIFLKNCSVCLANRSIPSIESQFKRSQTILNTEDVPKSIPQAQITDTAVSLTDIMETCEEKQEVVDFSAEMLHLDNEEPNVDLHKDKSFSPDFLFKRNHDTAHRFWQKVNFLL